MGEVDNEINSSKRRGKVQGLILKLSCYPSTAGDISNDGIWNNQSHRLRNTHDFLMLEAD